ncbi:MAG TPA: ABC transporter ATP-binding protein [Paenalcaligenes sp.]|nr:ABC transporter ATP-binding protein [Paenalcaligenes sp.]
MNLLETHQLNKWFGGLHVTGNVDFALKRGEVHCLVGPNGAGKSTFFKLILGEITPNSGNIIFDGVDITREPSYRRIGRGISVKFQVPGVFPEMTVEHNLIVALQRRYTNVQEVQAHVNRLLPFLHLAEHAEQLAKNLSHGQKQWLEIGMALSLEPKLLMLDEPTAGMTPDETFQTGQMILDLNKEGVTVLAVEHDMAFVRQIADQVTVLNYGKVFASGTIADIENDERVIEIYLGKAHV